MYMTYGSFQQACNNPNPTSIPNPIPTPSKVPTTCRYQPVDSQTTFGIYPYDGGGTVIFKTLTGSTPLQAATRKSNTKY